MAQRAKSDADYKNDLDAIAGEVYEAIYVHHAMEEINRLALNGPNVLAAMNEQPLFWQAHRATGQAALFMCLGRIFDTGETANSIHRVIRSTGANPQLFSKAALGSRKRAHGPNPPWLDAYLDGVWEPHSAADLKFLKDALKPHAALFEAVYKPIRHSVYGHRLMSNDDAGAALFPQTDREVVGRILDFLHDLVESITDLYLNGSKPELGVRDFTGYNQRIRDDARSVMLRLAAHIRP